MNPSNINSIIKVPTTTYIRYIQYKPSTGLRLALEIEVSYNTVSSGNVWCSFTEGMEACRVPERGQCLFVQAMELLPSTVSKHWATLHLFLVSGS